MVSSQCPVFRPLGCTSIPKLKLSAPSPLDCDLSVISNMLETIAQTFAKIWTYFVCTHFDVFSARIWNPYPQLQIWQCHHTGQGKTESVWYLFIHICTKRTLISHMSTLYFFKPDSALYFCPLLKSSLFAHGLSTRIPSTWAHMADDAHFIQGSTELRFGISVVCICI